MTGNTSKWRAPLAGLASVAMLATMGVAASTANALSTPEGTSYGYDAVVGDAKVYVYDADKPADPFIAQFDKSYGEALSSSELASAGESGKILDYLSLDRAGKQKVSSPYVVTGDVKLFAHYKDAVKVTFDVNNNGADASDPTVLVPKGTGLTAAEYPAAAESSATTNATSNTGESDYEFAGWTTTRTAKANTANDLYTGAALNASTVLYPRYAKAKDADNSGKDLATVAFKDIDGASVHSNLYTLNGYAFPAFRAPSASGSWKENTQGADYDFATKVYNADQDSSTPDKTLYDTTSAAAQDVTVTFDSQSAKYTPSDVKTTSDKTIAEPTAPVRAGAVFTGWYLSKNAATDESRPYDFSKSVNDNFKSAKGKVTLYAGWDKTNVTELVFNLGYGDWPVAGTQAQQVLFVRPGAKIALPTGLEEYYKTSAQADALNGYTAQTLTGWYRGYDVNNVVTSVDAPAAHKVAEFTAKWQTASSVKLDANGGSFNGEQTKWVTKDYNQSWKDVVVTPSLSGYRFVQWRNAETILSYGEGQLIANLADGNWYTVKDGKLDADTHIAINGSTLKAEWVKTASEGITALRGQFGVQFKNKAADQLTVEAYGYTADSAKAYVDAVYALEDEYHAYLNAADNAEKIAAADKLAPKYEAAQKLLVKSNGAEVPSGKEAVYRLFNPNAKNAGSHLYTTNFTEYTNLTRKGWTPEGVQFLTTSSKDATPLYRLYNKTNGAHHYTTDASEKNALAKKGWVDEGPAFYVDAKAPVSVWRAYNKNSGEHVYTIDEAEYQGLTTRHGWTAENEAFKAWTK